MTNNKDKQEKIKELQNEFDELTVELKQPLVGDSYRRLWDERVVIKNKITELTKTHDKQ